MLLSGNTEAAYFFFTSAQRGQNFRDRFLQGCPPVLWILLEVS